MAPAVAKPSYLSADQHEYFNEVEFAANQGDALAQIMLGMAYFNGVPHVDDQPAIPKNLELGKSWFIKATEGEESLCAMSMFAHSLEREAAVSHDYDEAVHWYRQAAEKGSIDSQMQLLKIYADGHYTPQDDQEISRWILNTAEHGMIESYAKAADLYRKGQSVPRNLFQAYKWNTKAIEYEPANVDLSQKQRDIAEQLTNRQLRSARKWIKAWKPKQDNECERLSRQMQ